MHQKLKEIIEQKQKEVALLRKEGIPDLDYEVPPVRDFKGAISVPERINLISEIKFASPSNGKIREQGDPAEIGRTYENAGASAISTVLRNVRQNRKRKRRLNAALIMAEPALGEE